MLALVHAGALVGVDALPVQVEVQLGRGLPGFDVVGLPDRAVRESRVRVKAAIQAEGYELPPKNLVLNLAPGDLRKSGSGFDLAIAIALLAGCDLLGRSRLGDHLLVGELSLGGLVRSVRGVLPLLRSARERGLPRAIVPAENAGEAALVRGIDVRCARTLQEVIDYLDERSDLPACNPTTAALRSDPADLNEVRGQASAKRALEIAAAGGHHLLLVGPPGSGKTMLARRLCGLLPPPTPEEALEIATIASAGGHAPPRGGRPFRAPHHTASTAALIGGGDPVRPGEVTLAHNGVLFLDELPEFRRDAIESLRTTMEEGRAVVARAQVRVTMPAAPLVVAAMNPCPCGWSGDPSRVCLCSPDRVERYRARVSGPLLDRFDLHVPVPRVPARELRRATRGDASAEVRARVLVARDRVAAEPGVSRAGIEELAAEVKPEGVALLERVVEQLGLSARAFVKVLRIAKTIAALEGRRRAGEPEVAEAIQYRVLDRETGDQPWRKR